MMAERPRPSDQPPVGTPLQLAPLAASVAAVAEQHYYLALPAAASSRSHVALGPGGAPTSEWVCLLLPTSLCSSEVARGIAAELGRECDAKSGETVTRRPHDGYMAVTRRPRPPSAV